MDFSVLDHKFQCCIQHGVTFNLLLASTFSGIWEGKNLDRWKTSVAFGGVCEEAPFPLFFQRFRKI